MYDTELAQPGASGALKVDPASRAGRGADRGGQTGDLALDLVTGNRQLSGPGNRGVLPVCHGARKRRLPTVPGGT